MVDFRNPLPITIRCLNLSHLVAFKRIDPHSTFSLIYSNTVNKGILLVNLGSPSSFEPQDVKVYLREFLLDKRFIDAPELIRKLIV